MIARPISLRYALALTIVVLTAVPVAATAQEQGKRSVDKLVDRIIALRGEVDDLDAKLDSLKKEHENRMSSLAREKGQLESKRENQELRIKKLQDKLAKKREQVREAGVATEELVPVLHDAIDGIRSYVRSSLPFKRGERLSAIDEIERQLKNDAMEPPRIANRLWSFYADELRLTGESGLFRQPIQIQGEERLVDVVRLGMMMLYFRTDDERYGYATRNADGWRFQYVDSSKQREQISSLFDAQRKQIRTGYFRLPNPNAAAESP